MMKEFPKRVYIGGKSYLVQTKEEEGGLKQKKKSVSNTPPPPQDNSTPPAKVEGEAGETGNNEQV